MKGGKVVVGGERAETLSEKARRVLQAAVVEAYGRPGEYVTRDPVMRRANIVDREEFRTLAEHLEVRGWIAETDYDYRGFVITDAGIDAAMR
jgi:RIO-like serine/threonine protein kinase